MTGATVRTARPPLLRSHADAVSVARGQAEALIAGAVERDRTGALPIAELAAFDASGLLSITIDRAAGGAGLGPRTLADVVRTLAAADPAVAQGPQGHFLMVDAISVLGDERQRAHLLGAVLAGGRIGNALAERGGANAQDLATTLRGGRLNGRKYYATGALTAAVIAVSALDEHGRLKLAFVERDAPGVTLDEDWHVFGQRATVSGGVQLEDVAVDPGLVLDYGRAFEQPQQLGARAQLYHAAIQVGIARGALVSGRWFLVEKARPYFEAARGGWARRAVDDPHAIHRFGQLETKVAAAEALLAAAADTLVQIGLEPADADAAARGSIAVAKAKAFASDTAVSVASDIFSLTGAGAANAKYGLDRHWRNARTHASHDPVDWKYHHVGAYSLDGVLPPNHGQL